MATITRVSPALDLRLYHSKLYFVELQAVQSWTDSAGASGSDPYLQAAWDRTGRQWGFHYTAEGASATTSTPPPGS